MAPATVATATVAPEDLASEALASEALAPEAPASESLTPAGSAWLETPLGPMLAVAIDSALLLLEFETRRGLTESLERLGRRYRIGAVRPSPIASIERELAAYFAGELREFNTPLELHGTPFQVGVWSELQRVPAGATVSYLELATAVGNPRGVRAVAQANGANRLAVVVPCHRVIESSGGLGGYGAGTEVKRRLLEHERAAFGAEAGRLF